MKLAFKTGSVDLSEGQSISYGIDDLRYFGTVGLEQDFPDLENEAFYRTPYEGGDFSGDSRLLSLGERPDDDDASEDMWMRNQAISMPGTPQSTIEIARGERTSLLSNRDRSSLSNQRSSFEQIGDISKLSVSYEDDIPVFGDQEDMLMMGGDDYYPPDDQALDYEPNVEDANFGFEETKGTQSPNMTPPVTVTQKTKKKKRRVVVDDKVELSNKELRKTMQDRSKLLRRLPDDPLVSSLTSREGHPSHKMSSASNIPGLCPELEELFTSSMKLIESRTNSFRASKASKADEPEVARRPSRLSHEPAFDREQSLHVEETPFSPQEGPTFELGGGDDYYPEPEIEYPMEQEGEEQVFVEQADFSVSAQENLMAMGDAVNSPIEASSEEWNPRTKHVFDIVNDQLQRRGSISFQDLSVGVSKRTAAACFLEILQLKTWNIIDVTQGAPFETIVITKVK